MCFSVEASFGAGIVLSVIGVASLKKAQSPSHLLFASIPLFFAVQQIIEGFLWLALPDPNWAQWHKPLTYLFLIFAQIVWPLWVPVSIVLLEKDGKSHKIQKIFVVLGLLVSVYLGYCLMNYPVGAAIQGYHISYEQDYPKDLRIYIGALYVISTIAPPFFSSIRRMWMLGTTVLISYLIATLFYNHYLVSVWCFFASIISFSVYLIMIEKKSGLALKKGQ